MNIGEKLLWKRSEIFPHHNVIFMEMQDELDRYKKDIVMGEFEKAISGLEKTMVVWRGLGNRKAGWTGRLWKKATVLAICNHSHEHVFETMQLHEGRMIGMGGRLALGFREMPKIPDDQVDCRKKFAGGEVVQLKKPIYAIGSEREGNAALYSE